MKIEVWSDVMCPFCYIGKRKFETALGQFDYAGDVEVIWKSYQLSPDMQTSPGKSIHQFLADHKGITLEHATEMNAQVAGFAAQAGLNFDFDRTIPANTFKAHRFAHLAKQHGLQDKAEEALFEAYFTKGENIDDTTTLVGLGDTIGLDAAETEMVLQSDRYAADVNQDIYEAQQIGVRGVPFFVFDRKVAVSGAQDSSVFLQALEKTYTEWQKSNPQTIAEIIQGSSCAPDEECG
ncbi:DsbA family oxidoreductase [Mucilaginibacter hurinus]|uniref:DsbA family oxidoreductase n=2 Tax=Mucilaginibacter hurinus TaxID=2201324 RepID=A0A367GRQ1_9SPHI|nr:DsbA family oxidoreductase [Mucilaginibacter hurinus]